jgi:hypothetical protein
MMTNSRRNSIGLIVLFIFVFVVPTIIFGVYDNYVTRSFYEQLDADTGHCLKAFGENPGAEEVCYQISMRSRETFSSSTQSKSLERQIMLGLIGAMVVGIMAFKGQIDRLKERLDG